MHGSSTSPSADFTGKIALVTGGGSGIGRASALAFAAAGARVVIADVNADGGQETVRVIEEAGGEAMFVAADVSRAADVAALIERTVASYGRLDYAHNNAGIGGDRGSVVECSEENWDRVLAVNLKGVWLCLKHEIAQMLRQSGGAIVNTASVAGLIGTPMLPAYGASKHGVISLTKSAALAYAKDGIRVNCVCPGFIDTPMLRRRPDAATNALPRIPVGWLGTPEEVAAAVVWLCSDAASFVTGHSLVTDGGQTA